MLIKDGSAPDKMSDGHRTYSGNDFTTRHWHFGKKSELIKEGTCLKCVYGEGDYHIKECKYSAFSIVSERIKKAERDMAIAADKELAEYFLSDTKENPGIFTTEGIYTNEKIDIVIRNFEITE